MFVPESPKTSDYEDIPVWQPGESLTITPQPSQQQDDLRTTLQSTQHTNESNFNEVEVQVS